MCLWLSSSFCYLGEIIQHLLPRSFCYFYLRWILFPFVSYACTIYPQFWWFNYISNFVYKKANNAFKIVSLELFELLTIDYWQSFNILKSLEIWNIVGWCQSSSIQKGQKIRKQKSQFCWHMSNQVSVKVITPYWFTVWVCLLEGTCTGY